MSAAAINCPNCGAKVSAERSRCPRCRAELRPAKKVESGPAHNRQLMLVTAILLLVFAAVIMYLWYTSEM